MPIPMTNIFKPCMVPRNAFRPAPAMTGKRAEYQVTADESDRGTRLDRWLAVRLPELSRSRLKALIEAGMVSQGGATIDEPSMRVKPGQRFDVTVPDATPPTPEGQAIPLSVVYEDDQLIVVDKAAGLVTHPAPGNPDRTLVNALIAHCGASLSGIGGVRRPGIVHRLDKDTSGLIVAAKSDQAYQVLAAQFQARTIGRSYFALVWGRPTPARGAIQGNIGRSPRNRKKMAVVSRGGKPAVTHYARDLSRTDGLVSALTCRLETGRTHQIRVHLSHQGHPLLGDPLYGGGDSRRARRLPAPARAALAAFERQALHAKSLAFDHPTLAKRLEFNSDLPLDLKNLTSSLELL